MHSPDPSPGEGWVRRGAPRRSLAHNAQMLSLLTTQALAAFTLALLGGLHCAGMCGGFVGALQVHRPAAVPAARLAAGYHAGRITSYTLAGALVGTLGGALYAADVLPLQIGLLVVGSLMLLANSDTICPRASCSGSAGAQVSPRRYEIVADRRSTASTDCWVRSTPRS